MARRVNDKLFDFSNTHTLAGGGKILFGTLAGYNPHYAYFGKLTQATPDGRCNGDFFTVGSGQGCGKDREGLAALLQSVAGMNPSGVLCGPFLCNVLIDEKSVRDEKSFDKLCHVLESYFNMGGLHVQLNYASEKELREARENPEKYRNLRVRVSGFSASYVKLSKETQDEILARTVNEQK